MKANKIVDLKTEIKVRTQCFLPFGGIKNIRVILIVVHFKFYLLFIHFYLTGHQKNSHYGYEESVVQKPPN